MIDVDIRMQRTNSAYVVRAEIQDLYFTLKYDTGAIATVISVKAIDPTLTDADIKSIENYCRSEGIPKREFLSASGHPIYGYVMSVHDVVIGGATVPTFNFCLVTENKRKIALLGFDFIDFCTGNLNAHNDVVITEFDNEGYVAPDGAMEFGKLIAFIDSLTEK